MAEEIRSVYQFDFVHDGQKVFRELLSAMANPGQIRNKAVRRSREDLIQTSQTKIQLPRTGRAPMKPAIRKPYRQAIRPI